VIGGIGESIEGPGQAVKIKEDKICGRNARASSMTYSCNGEPYQAGCQKWAQFYGCF
jgi:hypothetical protein